MGRRKAVDDERRAQRVLGTVPFGGRPLKTQVHALVDFGEGPGFVLAVAPTQAANPTRGSLRAPCVGRSRTWCGAALLPGLRHVGGHRVADRVGAPPGQGLAVVAHVRVRQISQPAHRQRLAVGMKRVLDF